MTLFNRDASVCTVTRTSSILVSLPLSFEAFHTFLANRPLHSKSLTCHATSTVIPFVLRFLPAVYVRLIELKSKVRSDCKTTFFGQSTALHNPGYVLLLPMSSKVISSSINRTDSPEEAPADDPAWRRGHPTYSEIRPPVGRPFGNCGRRGNESRLPAARAKSSRGFRSRNQGFRGPWQITQRVLPTELHEDLPLTTLP